MGVDRGREGAACDCQGLCGYGRGGSDHLMLATNKKSGLHGCHWCGYGQYDPSPGNGDKIVYCYEHKCKDGYVSVCEENVKLNINHGDYARSHRACTCAKAAGQWVRIPGSFQDTSITRSQWREHTEEVTKTRSSSIENSIGASLAIEEGYICTAGREEPPCCGPGANPTDTVNRKYCEDDFKSWTGQCDGYEHRTRVTSLQDSQDRCINFNDKCSDLLSSDLGGHLANCGAHCGNNAYANVFDPTYVFGQTNMLECNSRPGWTNTLFNNFCQWQKANEHAVFMLSRDCGYAVWARKASFDNAYRAAEYQVRSQDAREFIPIYYNNWYGACDGRRALAAEDVFEFEHCKCDTECPFWGDCCDHCKEAMEKIHDGEVMSKLEMEALRSLRATLTEEEYVKAKDDFEKETLV